MAKMPRGVPKNKNNRGRGREWEPHYDRGTIAVALRQYVDENESPTVEGFCLSYDCSRRFFYKLLEEGDKEIAHLHEKLMMKRESFIVENGMRNKINPIFGIFLLKQKCFGYRDKPAEEVAAKTEGSGGVVELPAIKENDE